MEKESGVFHVYFTGCGGDITMGKYNDGSHEGRPALVDRLYDGDNVTGYICTNKAYTDRGGYEQTESYVGPSEDILKEAIGKLLVEG